MGKALVAELFNIFAVGSMYYVARWWGSIWFFVPNSWANFLFQLVLIVDPVSSMFKHVVAMSANLAKPNSHKGVFLFAWLLLALKHFGWVDTNLQVLVSCILLTYRILVVSIWE